MTRPRLLMADDHTLVLEGFRRILEPEFDLVGTAEDGQTLVNLAVELSPDAVLLDIAMPVLNGFEAARQIRKLVPSAKLIFVTMHSDPEYLEESVKLGASGFLLKRSAASELIEAIREALRGGRYVTPLLRQEALAALLAPASERRGFGSRLSDRERQVLQHIAEGRQAKEIAHSLEISQKTVEFHKQSIVRKLGLRTTAELTRYAVRQGLVEA
jgi:DNA-binding NarL/FixJ family response regulator